MVTAGRIGRRGDRLALVASAAVGSVLLAWTPMACAQESGSPATTTAPPAAATHEESLSQHLHVLIPQEPTPEGILATEPPAQLAAPDLRRMFPGFAEEMEELPPF